MLKLLYCELLKLKRSKILLIAIPGALVAPVFILMMRVEMYPRYEFNAIQSFDEVIAFTMLLTNPIVYTVITAYLFSREYSENTLKIILTVPTKRLAFVTAKFITLFICFLFLTFVTWTGMLVVTAVCNVLFGAAEFGIADAFHYLWKMMLSGALMFFTITPFAFLAMLTKGYIVPVISSAVIVLGNVILLNSERFGELFPWTAAFILVVDGASALTRPLPLVAVIIAAVFVLGVALSMIYFQREDIK